MNKVMIIGGNPLELLGLKTLLKKGFEVGVETTEPAMAFNKSKEFSPDVILIDVKLNGYDLSELSTQLKEEYSKTKIMWLFSEEDRETELLALRTHIDGCVLKTDLKRLPRALKLVQEEEVYFPGFFLKKWLSQAASLVNGKSKEELSLSKREKEILELVRTGKTNPEIAKELFISPETVKTHLKNIRQKLNIKKTRQLSYNPQTVNPAPKAVNRLSP